MKKSLFTTAFIIVLLAAMGFTSCVEKKPEPVQVVEEEVCNDTLPKLTLYKKNRYFIIFLVNKFFAKFKVEFGKN